MQNNKEEYRISYIMSPSYHQISQEIGYTGYMPYPSLESVQSLFQNLCSNPTIVDFKNALRLYRFTPEAKTPDQAEIIRMMQTGLGVAMKSLYLEPPKRTIGGIVKEYIYKWVPTMTLFYVVNILLSNQTLK